MPWLDKLYAGNTSGSWLLALLVLLALFTVLEGLKNLLSRHVGAAASQTRSRIDDVLAETLRHTRAFFLFLISLYVASLSLRLGPVARRLVDMAALFALLLQLAIWGNAAIRAWIARAQPAQDLSRAAMVQSLGVAGRLLLWSLILLVALENVGVNVTALIAGLGVTGIAVALATQNILADLFASLSIMLDKPFVVGDTIAVDALSGVVEFIGIKTTRVRAGTGEQIVFSNADLLRSRIRNLNRMRERRVVFTIGVTYENAYERLLMIPAVVREVIECQPHTRFESCYFKEYRDFALNFEAAYIVDRPDPPTHLETQHAINLALFRRFHETGIEFAHAATARTQVIPPLENIKKDPVP